MSEDRSDPERLLAAARAASTPSRGVLKVWLGAAAGVGKTCAMLDAAAAARDAGRRVVIGVVEHHGRAETLARLEGLEVLPRRPSPPGHPPELDLDAALALRPDVLVVDELAHSNAPGSRHPRRWQDVEELRDAGIEVWTAVNVQHLERTRDVVERLTGVVVRETVPDEVLDGADEVVLVDLPPDALLARLAEGRVYGPEATRRALAGFFRKGNLLALRELALRRAAERVGDQVDDFRNAAAMPNVWAAGDRVLVAVGPSPASSRLLRVAARLAARLDAPWHAVRVRVPGAGEAEDGRAAAHLRMAEQLGATTATVDDEDVAGALVRYARRHNLNVLVLGASPPRRGWGARSLVDEVTRAAADVEVHVVPTLDRGAAEAPVERPAPRLRWADVGVAVAVVMAANGVSWWLRDALPESDILMLYLGAVVVAAFRLPHGASLVAALVAVASFNFLHTEPRFTFYVSERRYLLTFAVLGGLGVVVSTLASRVRDRAAVASRRAEEAQALYQLGRALAGAGDVEAIGRAAVTHVGELVGGEVTLGLPTDDGQDLAPFDGAPSAAAPTERAVARWALLHGRPAGRGTDTLPSAEGLYLPLQHRARCYGVLAVVAPAASTDDPERRHLLTTMADQVALALAREGLAVASARSEVHAATERARASLLASVSHDLRTPLATITGAATALQDPSGALDADARRRLVDDVVAESLRLERLLQNLLHLTRLDGDVSPSLEWQVAQEVVGAAVARAAPGVSVSAPDEPVWLRCDALLIEQAVLNLVENAERHGGGAPEVAVEVDGEAVRIDVADRGVGVDPLGVPRLFERFRRGDGGAPGAGLGLAIVAAVASVHGGSAGARPRTGGGSVFSLTLPQRGPDGAPWPEEAP
jgi:two-component system sensor histidine kinase KdpD